MKNYSFFIMIYENGATQFSSYPIKGFSKKVGLILNHFSSISELNWFKDEVLKAREMNIRTYTGLNTFECYVIGEKCELGYVDGIDNFFDDVPTQVVLDFIDQAIDFHKLYNSGGIPGIIPESKKEDWVIVPREFVKDEYWSSEKIRGED